MPPGAGFSVIVGAVVVAVVVDLLCIRTFPALVCFRRHHGPRLIIPFAAFLHDFVLQRQFFLLIFFDSCCPVIVLLCCVLFGSVSVLFPARLPN